KKYMAVKLISNYAKRLGLPCYSSHQFSVSVETELSDLDQVNDEVARLYHGLQDAVDREIQHTGFVPDEKYGKQPPPPTNGNGYFDRSTAPPPRNGGNGPPPDTWKCSDKQKDLIQKLVSSNNLDRNQVEQVAVERFGVGVRQLNKLQASGLIDELISSCRTNGGNGNTRKGGRE
ncbi:MAG: hypothetical protein P1V20_13160, partial [Verrucomicrobiales bacterium]|nr:hypothetical protein [Verrucomicrobiales bacterium]